MRFLVVGVERVKVFLLHLRHLAGVMPFTGIEDEEEAGKRAERKQSKHAGGE